MNTAQYNEDGSINASLYGVDYLGIPASGGNRIYQMIVDLGLTIDPYSPPSETPPRLVFKTVIIDRLFQAGKLDAAKAALDAADLYTQERWNARTAIYATDPDAIALLTAIGADPDEILAE